MSVPFPLTTAAHDPTNACSGTLGQGHCGLPCAATSIYSICLFQASMKVCLFECNLFQIPPRLPMKQVKHLLALWFQHFGTTLCFNVTSLFLVDVNASAFHSGIQTGCFSHMVFAHETSKACSDILLHALWPCCAHQCQCFLFFVIQCVLQLQAPIHPYPCASACTLVWATQGAHQGM